MKNKIRGLLNRKYTITLKDTNAVVGQKSDGMVVGNYGLRTKNEGDRLLIEFCRRNKFCIMNTWFKQPKRQSYT